MFVLDRLHPNNEKENPRKRAVSLHSVGKKKVPHSVLRHKRNEGDTLAIVNHHQDVQKALYKEREDDLIHHKTRDELQDDRDVTRLLVSPHKEVRLQRGDHVVHRWEEPLIALLEGEGAPGVRVWEGGAQEVRVKERFLEAVVVLHKDGEVLEVHHSEAEAQKVPLVEDEHPAVLLGVKLLVVLPGEDLVVHRHLEEEGRVVHHHREGEDLVVHHHLEEGGRVVLRHLEGEDPVVLRHLEDEGLVVHHPDESGLVAHHHEDEILVLLEDEILLVLAEEEVLPVPHLEERAKEVLVGEDLVVLWTEGAVRLVTEFANLTEMDQLAHQEGETKWAPLDEGEDLTVQDNRRPEVKEETPRVLQRILRSDVSLP